MDVPYLTESSVLVLRQQASQAREGKIEARAEAQRRIVETGDRRLREGGHAGSSGKCGLQVFHAMRLHGLLAPLRWIDVGVALVILLVVRPVTGLIALLGHKAGWQERLTLAFFGIRGVGSIYYLAYGLNHIDTVEGSDRLWAIVGLIILISILMHGITVTPVMRKLDRRMGRDPDADEATSPLDLQGSEGAEAHVPGLKV